MNFFVDHFHHSLYVIDSDYKFETKKRLLKPPGSVFFLIHRSNWIQWNDYCQWAPENQKTAKDRPSCAISNDFLAQKKIRKMKERNKIN